MVRTRDGSSYHGETFSSRGESSSLSHSKRRRPTTFTRRRRVQESHVDVIEEHEQHDRGIQHGYVEDDYVEHEDVQQEDVCEEEDEEGGFLGGPHDTFLLTHYIDHVAFAIWIDGR
ncbi:uncharacterized protein LOC108344236 [Vigna angularis]|uniref:uncharacterized protein LOC108344236 n=1 Tax=Phaseolus angularis TaxID=3914 RepID=UPI0022B58833|nr:uncharacterized protein LOC108344236 [Vigna angularis]